MRNLPTGREINPALSTVAYVDTGTVAGTRNGSITAPFATVEAAIADGFNTIYICSAVPAFDIDAAGRSIRLIGLTVPGVERIDPTITAASQVLFESLYIDSLVVNASPLIHFSHSTFGGIQANATVAVIANHSVIQDCHFHFAADLTLIDCDISQMGIELVTVSKVVLMGPYGSASWFDAPASTIDWDTADVGNLIYTDPVASFLIGSGGIALTNGTAVPQFT